MWALVLAGPIACYIVWTIVCLEINFRKASSLGIPCVRLPIDSHNVLWMVFESNVWAIIDALPFPWMSYPDSIRHLRRGWHFQEKASSHIRHGPIWALVTPCQINLHLSDADAIGDVFSRRRDFIRPVENYKLLEVFGPCISTVDAQNWSRHRKAVAAPFNEGVMSFVWTEALRQAKSLTDIWLQTDDRATRSMGVQKAARSITLNVLATIGFNETHVFGLKADEAEDSYRTALQTVLDNIILLMLVPHRVLKLPAMPKKWATIARAKDRYKSFMVHKLDEELKAIELGLEGSGSIMTFLVRALNVHQRHEATGPPNSSHSSLSKGLAIEELFGNLFAINFAGHDTTANTLAFALLLLAGDVPVQQWLAEEIRAVTAGVSPDQWTYESIFGKLMRCRAVLYETVRLYPPIMALPKGTDERTQSISVQGKQILVPPRTTITLSILACQTHPSVWPDPLAWKPSRWVLQSETDHIGSFYSPPKYTYFPWSEGPQNCPGKRFSEVEFIAILAYLFCDHKLEIDKLEGETLEESRERLARVINDVDMEMLLRMRDADSVRLRCYRDRAD